MQASVSSDVELARAFTEGRPGARDAFAEHFRSRVFQYSYLMCGHREDAEEVAQDTMLSALQNSEALREPEKVRSWVFQIAKNACLMKRRRSVFAPAQELSLQDTSEEPRSTDLPDEQLRQREIEEALSGAIRTLAPHFRAVVLLRDVEELSTEETAEILEVSTDVVKQRLHRARVALRKALSAYEP